MSGYYYACPSCDKHYWLADPRKGPYPDRTCWGCFDDGCKDCMPRGMCKDCEKEDQ